jgi:hypothetical protein
LTTGRSDLDIYQRFELEVRTPKRRLLLDAFLPSPDALPSVVAPPPPPPPLPGVSEEEAGLLARLGPREPEEPPPPRRRHKSAEPAKARKKRQPEKPRTLQEEIDEFMNRDGTALAPDDEPDRS